MANNYHQLSLKDTFSDCKDMFMDDVPSFFQLLEQHFDISLFLFHKLFITLFISLLVAKEIIRLQVSFLPLSCKKSFLSPRIPC